MRKRFLIFFPFILFSCISRQQNHADSGTLSDTLPAIAANGFKIIDHRTYREAIVFNPWQGAQNISVRYYLSENPSSVKNVGGPVIKIPVKKVVCLSTTHIAMIEAIGETESIVGISGKYLVSNKKVLDNIKAGKTFDVGYQNNMNYELLLGLKPDVIFAYGIGSEFSSYVKKLRDLGFIVVFNAEYLETEPLAKTEWVKFMSLFYNKYEMASSLFDSIRYQYDSLKQIAAGVKEKPRILYGLPWNGTWHMAGGESYAAKMIRDAGGDYLWADTRSHEALPLPIESVIAKIDSADIWINAGAALSKQDILSVEKRLAGLKIFKTGKIFNNVAILSADGGNDYWESGVMKPHIILQDMIKIFHPEIPLNHSLYFYKELK